MADQYSKIAEICCKARQFNQSHCMRVAQRIMCLKPGVLKCVNLETEFRMINDLTRKKEITVYPSFLPVVN